MNEETPGTANPMQGKFVIPSRHVLLVAVLFGSLAATSCATGGYYAYRVPPPPPPRMAGAIGFAPGPGFVWIDGFYDLRGASWVWVSGYWTRPPHPRATWVAPYWERQGNRYRFHRGRWRR
jgi:hypothetical protein